MLIASRSCWKQQSSAAKVIGSSRADVGSEEGETDVQLNGQGCPGRNAHSDAAPGMRRRRRGDRILQAGAKFPPRSVPTLIGIHAE